MRRNVTSNVWAFTGLYVVLWGAATGYLAFKGADWTFPLISFGIFGVTLSGAAIALTRDARPPAIEIRRPTLELAAVLAFMSLYAVGFLGFGMTFLKGFVPVGRDQDLLVLGAKLVVHVALPALLLAVLGARIVPLFAARFRQPGFWPPLIVLGVVILGLLSVVSPSLQQISELHPAAVTLAWAAPLAFMWIALEAGLCEEFLYRAVLQTRLAAVLRSEVGAVVVGALIFSLAHVPGLYLRGAPGVDGYSADIIQVAAFTIGALSPLAILFGVLWSRTRSLLLVVLLHAAVDVLPFIPEFLKTWVV